MIVKQAFFFSFLILICIACETPKSYTLEELETNQYNSLQLTVTPALDADGYKEMFQTFKTMDAQQILDLLATPNLELHKTSFGFYYLANAYSLQKDIEKTIKYHEIAAEKYINPQSLLKLAEFNFHVTKDYAKAYQYLHQSLEVMVEITENNRSHPLAKNGKDRAQFVLQELEKMGTNGAFDKKAVRTELKQSLPILLSKYREIYGLGPREGEAS